MPMTRKCYRRALDCEPGNPYYLADMIGFELRCSPRSEITASMRTVIQNAIDVCTSHAADGIELPFSSLTVGRLRLLLEENESAFNDYLLGAARCLDGKGCFGCEVIDAEIAWLHRVNFGAALPQAFRWAKNLLLLAKKVRSCATSGTPDLEPFAGCPREDFRASFDRRRRRGQYQSGNNQQCSNAADSGVAPL
jgi:hypothetical protein